MAKQGQIIYTSGGNPSNINGFWIRPILARQKGAIHAENKRQESLLELFKIHTRTCLRAGLINVADVFPRASIFLTKIRHSITLKPLLMTALLHTQFPNKQQEEDKQQQPTGDKNPGRQDTEEDRERLPTYTE